LRFRITILLLFAYAAASGQTLGGNAVYNFLKLPASAPLMGMGGVNVSYAGTDLTLAANNPALFRSEVHSQLGLTFNTGMQGTKAYAATGAWKEEKWGTSFGAQINYFDYGSLDQTDAAGNRTGSFRPTDFVAQVSAGRAYGDRFRYGANLKFIQSNYGLYKSSGIAVDFGLHYSDTAHGFTAGVLARNMGAQLKTYGGEGEDLPFDLQIGLTKRLAKAPLGFSLTGQQLHRFNLKYNDTTFNNENEFSSNTSFGTKLLNHFVFAAHVYLGANLEATVGYNHLRRSDLTAGNAGNGLTGFSVGLQARFQKLQFSLARSTYQRNISWTQLGLTLKLDRFFGSKSL
jgi:hypothetical protein